MNWMNIKSWCSCQISQGCINITRNNSVIWTMYFSPCFFQNDNPKFRPISLWKFRFHIFAPFSAWNMIINNNFIFASINIRYHSINAMFVILMINKQFFDPIWILSKACKRCQEIAISKLPLFNIIWLNFSLK